MLIITDTEISTLLHWMDHMTDAQYNELFLDAQVDELVRRLSFIIYSLTQNYPWALRSHANQYIRALEYTSIDRGKLQELRNAVKMIPKKKSPN